MWIVHSLPSELAYSQSILRILQVFPFHFSIPPLSERSSGTWNRQVALILLEYREQGGHGSAHCTGRTQLPVRKQGPPPLPFRGTQNWRAQVLSFQSHASREMGCTIWPEIKDLSAYYLFWSSYQEKLFLLENSKKENQHFLAIHSPFSA